MLTKDPELFSKFWILLTSTSLSAQDKVSALVGGEVQGEGEIGGERFHFLFYFCTALALEVDLILSFFIYVSTTQLLATTAY